MMKLAVVGPSAEKWKPEQIQKVKREIKNILYFKIPEPILISGHCPKGGVDILAEEIADELGIKKEIYPAEINQWPDGSKCLCCGEILPFTNKELITKHTKSKLGDWNNTKRLKGFRSRNIQIAEACDVLYCIVPKTFDAVKTCTWTGSQNNKQIFCNHCKMYGHPTNGGCWTMKYARKLGKETHLIVIE